MATCLFMPHVPHATCCKRADTHTARLLDSCLTKCLVDFWKICTTWRQLAPWQAGRQAGWLASAASLFCTLPPCSCPCCAPEKVHKMARSVSSSACRASELIHFGSGTRQSHICGRQTRLSSFSVRPRHSAPLPSATALHYCLALWQRGHA